MLWSSPTCHFVCSPFSLFCLPSAAVPNHPPLFVFSSLLTNRGYLSSLLFVLISRGYLSPAPLTNPSHPIVISHRPFSPAGRASGHDEMRGRQGVHLRLLLLVAGPAAARLPLAGGGMWSRAPPPTSAPRLSSTLDSAQLNKTPRAVCAGIHLSLYTGLLCNVPGLVIVSVCVRRRGGMRSSKRPDSFCVCGVGVGVGL